MLSRACRDSVWHVHTPWQHYHVLDMSAFPEFRTLCGRWYRAQPHDGLVVAIASEPEKACRQCCAIIDAFQNTGRKDRADGLSRV